MTPTEIVTRVVAEILGVDPEMKGSAYVPRPCCGLTPDVCWQRCGEEMEE